MFSLALCVLTLLRVAHSLPLNSPLLSAYDYIVIGGGVAGLTVANRLSEDPNINVLLLEAGPADNDELFIEVPGMIGDGIGSLYDWNLSTVAQTYLNGAPRNIPQGHGLGGGSLINGMLWSRGEIRDYDNWVELGNDGWSWDDMLPYFMRSETYTPVPSEQLALQYSIEANMSVHGTAGPVNVSFPHYFYNASANLFAALNELGIPTAYDPNTSKVAGASFLPLSLDPVEETRSDARRAYYDPWASRPNLWVSTRQYATQIIFDSGATNGAASVTTSENSTGAGNSSGMPGGIFGAATTLNLTQRSEPWHAPSARSILGSLWRVVKRTVTPRQAAAATTPAGSGGLRAIGVEFAPNAQSQRQTINVTREVIVAAGALHSPQLLMMSGIGPASALQNLSIPVNVDMPGVGSNLQDHGQVWCWYPYNSSDYFYPSDLITDHSFAKNAWTDYWANRTGPMTSAAFDGVAFPSLPFILNGSTAISDAASAQSATQYLAADTEPSVASGFARQLPLLVSSLSDPARAGYEIINGNDGALTVANMRPLSRGAVTLNSSQPFDPPVINPRYGSNPIDAQVLLAAIRFNERLLTTNGLSELDPKQMYPAPGATDGQILQYISSNMQTEYHPAGTCAMMPLDLGGVVSPELLVYGTSNLRVVDSSIIPMLPAAHLQAVVYGIGEKAADIIKAANTPPSSSGSPQPAPPATQSPTTTQPLSMTASQDQNGVVTTFVTVVATQTVYV